MTRLQAVEAYEGAVRVDGAHHAAALALAKLHLDKGEEEAGRAVCGQLLTAQPDNVEAQLLMVHLLATQVTINSSLAINESINQSVTSLCPWRPSGGSADQIRKSNNTNRCASCCQEFRKSADD